MALINTSHKEVVKSVADFKLSLLKNPYYLFNDKQATIVDYYNLNTTRSTLDQALRIEYSQLDSRCPLRFNHVNGLLIYGLSQIAINLEAGDFGLESSEISGEAFVLPNTITPYPGDYFIISYLKKKKKYLFKVTECTPDTFDDGGNFWRINYKLETGDGDAIEQLVVDEFEFHTGTVGSNFASVVRKTTWDLAKELDDRAVMLKEFYKSLYYNNKVQTFTCVNLFQRINSNQFTSYFYDPYLIQFILNNDILRNDGNKYIYMGHKTSLPPEFAIRYHRSIWQILESREMDNLEACTIQTFAKYISDPGTIFQTRYEDYFELIYSDPHNVDPKFAPPIQILDQQVVGHILENQLFDFESSYAKYNIIIKYMNNEDVSVEDIFVFDRIQECERDMTNYFFIPMAIFCIEWYIKKMLS